MAKKRSLEAEGEVRSLQRRLTLTLQFMENAQDFPSGRHIRAIVDSAAKRNDLKTLGLVARDLDAMTSALSADQRDGLNALLSSRLGIDAEAERAAAIQGAVEAVRRGTIRSEKERQHLEQWAELLKSTGDDPATLSSLRRLLTST